MIDLLYVGAGGFIGSALRYVVGGVVYRVLPAAIFPFGTLAVNVIGCLAIGYGNGLADARQLFGAHARLFLFIGLLGGFTTFSTFGFETFALGRDAESLKAVVNVVVHVVAGLAAVWLGYGLAHS